jgi:tetratricopeptide (TPR) repeat protein
MRLFLLLSAAAPLVLLSACATAPGGKSPPASEIASAQSSYGMFLAGESAMNNGKNSEAARFFDQARTGSGGDSMIAERAFTSALLAGDVPRAVATLPPDAEASEATKRLGRLVVAVENMAQGKGKEALTLLNGEGMVFPHKAAAALLAPWAAAEAGDVEGSLVRPQVRGDRLVDYFGQLGQAALFERAKRYDEAETDFKALTSVPTPSDIAVLAYGGFLERRGRRVDAVALYGQQLARQPASGVVGGRGPPPPRDRGQGAASAAQPARRRR